MNKLFIRIPRFPDAAYRLNAASPIQAIGPWLLASLAFPVYAGVVWWRFAFSHPGYVQDDIRQHVVWFRRFLAPELFQDDLIADYFLAIAPKGIHLLYSSFAGWGVDPVVLAKVLPPVIGVLATVLCFRVTLRLCPVPPAAFLAALILSQNLWLGDDLVSATSRAFPILWMLLFLEGVLGRSLWLTALAIGLQGMFYPILLLVQAGILVVRLVVWDGRQFHWSQDRRDYWLCALGVPLALGVIWLVRPDLGDLGPTVTAAQMAVMPEFQANGRTPFFDDSFWNLWLISNRGLSPPFYPPLIWLSLLLPVALRGKSPLVRRVTPDLRILWDVLFPSLGLFLLAHIVLLKLYYPSRYTQHSLRVAMAIAAGIAITLLLDQGWRWLRQHRLNLWQAGVLALVSLFALASLVVPLIPAVLTSGHVQIRGQHPALYEFFAQQPMDSRIASLTPEADNLPVFSQRSVIVSREAALPFHQGYYQQIQQRVSDLLLAQSTTRLSTLQQITQQYGIDFWLVRQNSFSSEAIAQNPWLMQFQPAARQAIARLETNPVSALVRARRHCTVFQDAPYQVIDAACLLQPTRPDPAPS
jgi:hypothetical protein